MTRRMRLPAGTDVSTDEGKAKAVETRGRESEDQMDLNKDGDNNYD